MADLQIYLAVVWVASNPRTVGAEPELLAVFARDDAEATEKAIAEHLKQFDHLLRGNLRPYAKASVRPFEGTALLSELKRPANWTPRIYQGA